MVHWVYCKTNFTHFFSKDTAFKRHIKKRFTFNYSYCFKGKFKIVSLFQKEKAIEYTVCMNSNESYKTTALNTIVSAYCYFAKLYNGEFYYEYFYAHKVLVLNIKVFDRSFLNHFVAKDPGSYQPRNCDFPINVKKLIFKKIEYRQIGVHIVFKENDVQN